MRFPFKLLSIWLGIWTNFMGFGLGIAHAEVLSVRLERPGHSVVFQAETARTPRQLAQGLMGRQKLHPMHGMLFMFPQPDFVKFWMKNTLIPLDLIFIDSRRQVVQIHPQAQPFDLTFIFSRQRVHYVLEVSAGSVQDHHIMLGDTLIF